ncbi:MAG: hypothetical protein V4632_01150 [Pseudomonadota bacterium]
MNKQKFATAGLQARIALARFGWANGLACGLCMAAIIGGLSGIPYLQKRSEAQELALTRARQALQSAAIITPASPPLAEERLGKFYDALGEKRHAEQQLKTLFAIARKSGLALNQAEYKSGADGNGRFHTYQILLPVKGSYAAIRQFCEQSLLAIPFASLDEMSFKRDAVSNRSVDAKLRFTLYLFATPEAKS